LNASSLCPRQAFAVPKNIFTVSINIPNFILLIMYERNKFILGARGGVLFKALRYKPAVRGFDSHCCHWNFSVT
jgi:hypothetical protein